MPSPLVIVSRSRKDVGEKGLAMRDSISQSMTLLFARTGWHLRIRNICTSRVDMRIKYLTVCLCIYLL